MNKRMVLLNPVSLTSLYYQIYVQKFTNTNNGS